MKTRTAAFFGFGLAVLSVVFGCTARQKSPGPDNIAVAYVDADGSHESATRDTLHNPFPHLLMADGRLTANDRCPVRKVPLNRRLPALFANGRAIGFC